MSPVFLAHLELNLLVFSIYRYEIHIVMWWDSTRGHAITDYLHKTSPLVEKYVRQKYVTLCREVFGLSYKVLVF